MVAPVKVVFLNRLKSMNLPALHPHEHRPRDRGQHREHQHRHAGPAELAAEEQHDHQAEGADDEHTQAQDVERALGTHVLDPALRGPGDEQERDDRDDDRGDEDPAPAAGVLHHGTAEQSREARASPGADRPHRDGALALRPSLAILTRPIRSAVPPMSTMKRPENRAVIETARFIDAASTNSLSVLMSSMTAGATVPAVPAKSQNVTTARTMPSRSRSLPGESSPWSHRLRAAAYGARWWRS